MSGSSTPTSDEPRMRITRTVAIIKSHALEHRLTIERRIEEAGFEIVKERQMEFADNSDKDFLDELFGVDSDSLFEGPVWVYVLERRRAVEVLKTLMGEEDPQRARETSPNSLRALFGINIEQNAIMGSPDIERAEQQIECLFQSSPPFPPQDTDCLDDADDIHNEMGNSYSQEDDWQNRETLLSPSSSQLSGSARFTSSVSSTGVNQSPNGKVPFKARPIPKTTLVPDISPRTTRAAALRAGVTASPSSSDRVHKPRTKDEQKQAFMDVPGHKRSTVIQVASTAAPTIAPRMTRAASLRLGLKVESPAPKMRTTKSDTATFEGVPGHKRRETIAVASVQAPTVTPRLNKSAELRARKDTAPPTSFMFRGPTATKTPGGLSRSVSQNGTSRPASSLASSRPGSAMSRSTSSLGTSTNRRQTMTPSVPSTPQGRIAPRNSVQTSKNGTGNGLKNENENNAFEETRSLLPPRPPSIEPRLNRSAMLRAKVGGSTPPVKQIPSPVVANRRRSMIV